MSRHRVFTYSLFFIYILFMTALMIYLGIGIALDRYAFLLLFFAFLIGKLRKFIIDWFPFIFIWLSYDFLRGLADNLSTRVHFLELINAEQALFGFVPTIELQKLLYNPGRFSFLDFLATIFYFLHFALAEAFAFFLWLKNRAYFREFVTGILLLSYAGWISYVIFPSAPPWMAQEKGLISGATKILDQTLLTFPERLNLPTIYHQFNPNPVAAIPSMHAAYPVLIFLYSLRFFKLRAFFFLPFVLGVGISIVYLGEHYVVDIIAGAIYAVVFYIVAKEILHHVKFLSWLRRKQGRLLGWSVQSAKVAITLPQKILSTPRKKSA